ncbi:hypothetical protein chiPu_0025660 [Chiloscyllium punctatum]|uniref:Uncharacterized protein n=1 Tax=Chiloscyllium punctatum TaxID=137246 RepID=A0A401TGG9_CHIPU|nr:hypothetical protein [Chiloscyllium punctatum]
MGYSELAPSLTQPILRHVARTTTCSHFRVLVPLRHRSGATLETYFRLLPRPQPRGGSCRYPGDGTLRERLPCGGERPTVWSP